MKKAPLRFVLALCVSFTLACGLLPSVELTAPLPLLPGPTPFSSPIPMPTARIILQRLQVSFHGLDGYKHVGSGCPGEYGRGGIIDYHFSVSGVDTTRTVSRIVLTGDNSTITWAWPCTDNWELAAFNLGAGQWDIFVAPSEKTQIYTILFFYSDNSIALGMVSVP